MKESLQPVKRKIAYLGIDYHVESVTIAVIIEGEKDIDRTVRFVNQDKMIKKFLKRCLPIILSKHVMKHLAVAMSFKERCDHGVITVM